MADSDRHRDLLTCLTAVEHGYTSTEALAPYLDAWLLHPGGGLIDLLTQRGILSSGQTNQLQALVAEKFAGLGGIATSEWKTVPRLGESTALDAHSTAVDYPDGVENTREQTSAWPATRIARQNDERFHIVSAYAEGGLGTVSVAQDTQLGRMIALKQIKTRWADDAEARARFLREAQITGRLEHPGIVPVYALGCDASGRPYYAMRFVEGETLQQVIERFHAKYHHTQCDHGARLLELRKLLRRLIDVCNTVDYAHNRGIIHRDLKPANILLGKYGETLVVDWGLAKVIGSDKLPPLPFQEIISRGGDADTVLGHPLGTPAYMSPEQAAGRVCELSPQTDVYSLGVTLYHVLAGQLPYESESVSDLLEQVTGKAFPAIRKHCPWIPASLEAICQKALAPRAADRYASMAALADDIERSLADQPTTAYTPTIWHRLSRWWRKRS